MSLLETHPELVAYWHPTLNGEINPSDVTYGSRYKAWWLCELGHEYERKVQVQVKTHTCPYCTNKKLLKGFNDLETKRPDLLNEWNYKLNTVSPEEIRWTSTERVHWKCVKGHTWVNEIRHRAVYNNNCKICTNFNFIDLKDYPELIKQWSLRNKTNQSEISATEKYLWTCSMGHEWEATLQSRLKGSRCLYCINYKVLKGFNDLLSVAPNFVDDLHPTLNNNLAPSKIIYSSRKKVWWVCKNDTSHVWQSSIRNRTVRGDGCTRCSVRGFNPSKPSQFYFMKNEMLKSYKVGITDKLSTRVRDFQAHGWTVIKIIENDNGYLIKKLEKSMLRWIRKDLQLPIYLTKEETPRTGGWTETFGIESIKQDLVVHQITKEWLNINFINI